MKTYDLIVLGGGTAGMTVARAAASNGWQVAVTESQYLGGTCVNVGCIPSKALIHTAKIMHQVRTAGKYGIHTATPEADWTKILQRKDEVVREMREGGYSSVAKNENITLYEGEALFIGTKQVMVAGTTLEADKILITTGARTAIPPFNGLETTGYLTSTTAMEIESLPESLLILGGGIIAVEFAQMFARFGVQVTIIQRGNQLAKNLEPEISDAIQSILESENVEVLTGTDVLAVRRENGQISVTLKRQEKQFTEVADNVLAATGRTPNTDMLALDKAGVETDKRGYITVDDKFATNVPGIWAAGDVTGGAMFTHKAWHDGFLLSRSFFRGEAISSKNRLIPYAVFTDPEIAGVGLGEQQAKDSGIKVKVQRYPFAYVGRSRATGQREGFVKLITEEESGHIVGAHIIGAEAGEIIHELIMAMRFNATVFDLQDMIHIHPTLTEAINSAGLAT
jgi:dihydrolipoamide dehydrogenase